MTLISIDQAPGYNNDDGQYPENWKGWKILNHKGAISICKEIEYQLMDLKKSQEEKKQVRETLVSGHISGLREALRLLAHETYIDMSLSLKGPYDK